MPPLRHLVLALATLALATLAGLVATALPLAAAPAERRIALVIGNGAYAAGPIPTAANDAGLVAQTLQAAGFDVVGARDLDEESLRRTLRDFTDKAAAAGPDAVAFLYLSGYGLQLENEAYFAPVDARIETASDVPLRTLRVSDYVKRLAALPLKARFVVLDAARTAPFRLTGDPLAGGLPLVEAEPGSLIATNAAPGTVGPAETGPYGSYALALVEMIRDGGLTPAALFERVRLRVAEATSGPKCRGAPRASTRRSCSWSGRPGRPRSPASRCRRSPSARSARGRPTPPASAATPWRDTRNSSAPIRAIRWPSACGRSSRHGAKP